LGDWSSDVCSSDLRRFTLSDLSFGERRVEETVRRALLEKIDYTRLVNIRGSDADEKAVNLARANLRRALQLAKMPNAADTGAGAVSGAGKIVGVEFSCISMQDAAPLGATQAGATLIGASAASALVAPARAEPAAAAPVRDAAANEAAGSASLGGAPGFIITNPPYGNRIGEVAEAEARYAEMAALSKNFPGWKLALITDHQGFESHFGKKADSCRGLKSGAADAWLYQYEKL
jgi:putative N6-adenine-specific DNA methylase